MARLDRHTFARPSRRTESSYTPYQYHIELQGDDEDISTSRQYILTQHESAASTCIL